MKFKRRVNGPVPGAHNSHYGAVNNGFNIFQLWEKVGSIMKAGKACYSTIKCLALLLLVTPHSNAQSERIFSMVNKNLRADHCKTPLISAAQKLPERFLQY